MSKVNRIIKTPTDMANCVLERYSLRTLPINLKRICRKEGIKIEIVEDLFLSLEAETGKEIGGASLLKRGNKIIFARFSDTAQGQRFTIAHELGHYFMHSGFYKHSKSVPLSFISFKNDKDIIEVEANRFAAELLMPKNKVFEEYTKMWYPYSRRLSEIFGVSETAMELRMEELGLLY